MIPFAMTTGLPRVPRSPSAWLYGINLFRAMAFSFVLGREKLAAVRDHNRRLSRYVLDLDGALADNVRRFNVKLLGGICE